MPTKFQQAVGVIGGAARGLVDPTRSYAYDNIRTNRSLAGFVNSQLMPMQNEFVTTLFMSGPAAAKKSCTRLFGGYISDIG